MLCLGNNREFSFTLSEGWVFLLLVKVILENRSRLRINYVYRGGSSDQIGLA
jgi:hypothetical protein